MPKSGLVVGLVSFESAPRKSQEINDFRVSGPHWHVACNVGDQESPSGIQASGTVTVAYSNCQENRKMGQIVRFFKDEEGATAIEYGLLAALISIAAIAGMNALGSALNTTFSTTAGTLN
jgi:pilus assembly protein Flp/PilA